MGLRSCIPTFCLFASVIRATSLPTTGAMKISIDWNESIITSKTSTTLQVVANPLILRNSSIHDNAFQSLSLVSSNYVRFVPWFPYPKLSVPELEPPARSNGTCSTSWDFTYMDEMMEDLYKATPGVKHIINFSTTPDWMWINESPYTYPEDINVTDFSYNNGTQLRDPTLKEVSDYYGRLVSWYSKGGFTDECGVYHNSDYHFDIEFWEVLNEVEAEHTISPGYYNQIYDAIVTAIHEVSPTTQFVGLALGSENYTYFESFLNSTNHKQGIPLDWISYHFYAGPTQASEPVEAGMSYQLADTFLVEVANIEEIRKKLHPSTRTTLDEIGTFDPLGTTTIVPGYTPPPEYWVWSGGIYAYVFANVAKMGIDVVGESQLVGYPGQYPSVSMVNYTTGKPNARLRVLQLLQHSLHTGDVLVKTTSENSTEIYAQAFSCGNNVRKLLLINKLATGVEVYEPAFEGGVAEMVDVNSGEGMWHTVAVNGSSFTVSPYATAILTIAKHSH